MTYVTKSIALMMWITLFSFPFSYSQIKLPHLISDGVILQRNSSLQLWGWASPGEKIKLAFKKKEYNTVTGTDGKWEIKLEPQKEGGPHEMIFKGNNSIKVKNIMFGDVWLCAGQSNMVLPVERVKEKYPDEVKEANYPYIRHFFIPTTTNLAGPTKDLPYGEWKSATGKDLLGFSATAYFFAKEIYKKYKIPVGLINASVGGTPIQAWISEEGLKSFPEDLTTIQKNKDSSYTNSLARLEQTNVKKEETDKGLTENIKWYEQEYTPKGWKNINIPGYWEDQGVRDLNGIVWYRKVIDVPPSMSVTPAKLFMGRIVDADFVYVNGTKVGNITYQYPPRRYEIPQGILKPGKNTIVIRVINYAGKGGFVPDKPYNLVANGKVLDLKGTWQYKVGGAFEDILDKSSRFVAQNQPSALYNAMVAPIINTSIKGILWYQGESNTGNPEPYYHYLPALIKDWRNKFNSHELPFLYVQLANFMEVDYLPVKKSNWAELRNAQLKTLSVPNTAMTVAIDLGEWNDIHPLDKENVGKRLALGAFKLAYNENIIYSGPIYKSSEITDDKIIISFENTGNGLISIDNESLRTFEVASADQKFVTAEAHIEGNRVIVSNKKIQHPEFVRYAWSDNPEQANLYNQEGLPASPFRNFEPEELNKKTWRGKKAAVVLTYDDALNSHLDKAIPLLDSLNLKATFYLTAYSSAFKNRLNEWGKAAQNGHELGNHTLFHPCDSSKPNREWVKKDYDMNTYSMDRMLDEIKMTNVVLEALDKKKERTFAFTCGDKYIANESFIDYLKDDFTGARSVRGEMHTITEIDVYNIDSYMINGESGEQLVEMVKEAIKDQSLLVFLFHGVGGDHSLNVSASAHKQLLEYLKANQHKVWITTMKNVVNNITHVQQNN
ncbi:sialate O-acetylesterase [Abyssalbus ytuae]|uniref:Polysaccharide deacetylase family protein n=1 Tax=Abyssalbus ytuae TaxID=2926907 RepID=A0A9E6ZNH7_9FLAO|nr:sialate O-acetylesterase [Abyssalbus ytuae]UOB17580.1 polysaccharide deacetylase family protein [Abyssalbus ytuae]